MKYFHRDNLKYKEIHSKLSPFIGLCILSQVWTQTSDLPTLKIYVQIFFLEKVWLKNTLPTYSLDICPNFRSFFPGTLPYQEQCLAVLPESVPLVLPVRCHRCCVRKLRKQNTVEVRKSDVFCSQLFRPLIKDFLNSWGYCSTWSTGWSVTLLICSTRLSWRTSQCTRRSC